MTTKPRTLNDLPERLRRRIMVDQKQATEFLSADAEGLGMRSLEEIAEAWLADRPLLYQRESLVGALREAADAAREACKRAVANDREIRDEHWRTILAAAEHRAEVAGHAARKEEREALRAEMTEWIEDITRGRVLSPDLLFKTDVMEWLDDRSRGEEPNSEKP